MGRGDWKTLIDEGISGLRSAGDLAEAVQRAEAAFRGLTLTFGAIEDAAEAAARLRSEDVLRRVVEHSSDQFSFVGADLTIRSVSPSVERLITDRSDPVIGTPVSSFVHADDLEAFHEAIDFVRRGGTGCSTRLEYRVRYDDGTWRYITTAFTNLLDHPDIAAIVLNSHDTSAKRQLKEELERRELFDSLTGLPNRSLFLDRTSLALKRAARRGASVAVVLVDFDDFQLVNDSFGHAAGDALLRAAGSKLETLVRADDTIAHIGADEFAILVAAGEMPRAAHLVAERVFGVLDDPVIVDLATYNVRASIGIAVGGQGMTAEDLLRNADLAVAGAKKNGKGCIEVYREEMHDEVVRKLHTANELRRGIGEGEIEPFFQPIVNVATAQVVGAEALARWRHPERGLVAPFEFIPLAEATGLIVPMGTEILRRSCEQRVRWAAEGIVDSDFYVSVNVSPVQLQREDVVEAISAVISGTGVDPASVVLEITETSAMQRIEEMMERLEALKSLGLRLALDDFGTGYSSLGYLSRLPMDIVKIDKSFVDRITGGHEGLKIVKTMVDLGTSLDLTTLAEGVEEEEQLAVLGQLGCRSYQGFFFAKPMAVEDFDSMLASKARNVTASLSAQAN